MGKSRYNDSKILSILNQAESGTPVPELCRKYKISSTTFYKWCEKYRGTDAWVIGRLQNLGRAHRQPEGEYRTATREKEFDILYETAQKNWTACLDFIFKHGAIISIAAAFVLGVGIDSLFKPFPWAPTLAMGFFSTFTVLHFLWLRGYYLRSLSTIRQLDELGFTPRKRYNLNRVTRTLIYSVQFYHTLLVILICLGISASVPGDHSGKTSARASPEAHQPAQVDQPNGRSLLEEIKRSPLMEWFDTVW